MLSVFPTPPQPLNWDLNKRDASLRCELGFITHYVYVSLDENVKLYIAQVALIK